MNPLGLFYDPYLEIFIVTTPIEDLVIKASNPEQNLQKSFIYNPKDSVWNNINHYTQIPDSLLLDYTILGVSDFEGTYYGAKDSSFIFAGDYGKSITDQFGNEFYLDGNTVIGRENRSHLLFKFSEQYSDEFRLIKLVDWQGKSYAPLDLTEKLNIDSYSALGDTLFYSSGDSLFLNTTYPINGEFENQFITTFQDNINGLYLKPNSDSLFVLTEDKLFVYSLEEQITIEILELPVSTESSFEIPNHITLHQNYPNPFNPSTSISYTIPHTGRVKLSVFDQLGRRVQILVDEVQSEGTHTSGFRNESLASGIYYYQLIFEDESIIKKMTLIK